MTAEVYPFSMEFLSEVSRKIVNEVEGISLITYSVTSKSPDTIELQ
jgi:GMP synthase (glutamine-hydrolysing)